MGRPYNVGIYCRLSVDDARNSARSGNCIPADESVSIENQYEMLSKFTMLNGWTEVKKYCDDGYSGADFQRPAFLEMIEDARQGLIDLILVKDLSRLGRDFVEVGRYTDEVFPSLGCRFVSVLDCLDSEGDNTDMLHFRSLMNDYHLKDLSTKIRSVLHSKMKEGQFLGAYAPYGYRKSPEDKHRLVVDEVSAAVVRRIFDMRQRGMSYGKIAAVLNREGILSPRFYWNIHYGKGDADPSVIWLYATVKDILRNRVYIGALIQNKKGHRSYKDKSTIRKDKSQWICHENDHEAIISKEVWDSVQELNAKAHMRANVRSLPQKGLFSGKLICADCGTRLVCNRQTVQRKKGGIKQYLSYHCVRYHHSGGSCCTRHTIHEITLKRIVLEDIKAHAAAIELNEADAVDRLRKKLTVYSDGLLSADRSEINKLRRRVGELEQLTAQLYEDKVKGAITADAFAMLITKHEKERIERSERLDALLAQQRQAEKELENISDWIAVIQKHIQLQELDRDVVDELIDHIVIGETKVVDGKRVRDVSIFYRFVGLV